VSPYAIDFQDEFGVQALPAERMAAAMTWVLDQHETEDGTAISVVITTDEAVQQLNQQYRGVDAATDILSFPADPLPEEIAEEMDEEDSALYLGDLIIAYPYTLRHAQEAGHAIDDELVLLVIHGTLHLLGYDHDNAEHQDDMWAQQSEALRVAQVAIEVPRFRFDES